MDTQKGCKFCRRYGLPLLPVRPAVKEEADALPVLPATISVPAAAQGSTAWTGRLLREGFLYIWYESGNHWINYFATREGYITTRCLKRVKSPRRLWRVKSGPALPSLKSWPVRPW